MRILVIPVVTLILLPATAQEQFNRPGKKPGEIITRPDFSQGGIGEDHLEVGKIAPPFTLQWLKRPPLASTDKEKNSSSTSTTVSLAELHAKNEVRGNSTLTPIS